MNDNLTQIVLRTFYNDVGSVLSMCGDVDVQVHHSSLDMLLRLRDAFPDLHAVMNTFEGIDLHGMFLLIGDADSVKAFAPIAIDDVPDWLRELANLTAGQVQNSIYEYGVECRIGLPVSVDYREWLNDQSLEVITVKSTVGEIFAVLDSDCDPKWQKTEAKVAASAPQSAVIF